MGSARPPTPNPSDTSVRLGGTSAFPAIADYALIGDCRSAALVSRAGSIDWLCWPRFDSPAVLAALLDRRRGGLWRIAPLADSLRRSTREYLDGTNVLRTTFECDGGTLQLTDLMPVSSEQVKRETLQPAHEIIRHVACTSGEVELEMEFSPRELYGLRALRLRQRGSLGIQGESGRGVYWLRSQTPLNLADNMARAQVRLRAGQSLDFSFSYSEDAPAVLPPLGHWTGERIRDSVAWWRQWAARAEYDGPHRDAILRSALALKLLTYAPSGAIIAAVTTSLPEQVGGSLNWDYRYCWLRDASMTVRALMGLGYREEADAFVGWLLNATRLTRPQLRILYTLFGEIAPHERDLKYLEGYRGSRPVRIGNAARHQLQLDVYGEVLDAMGQFAFHGGEFHRGSATALVNTGKYVASNWNQPDQGIWEPRERPEDHTHSRVLCWTALDRLITLAKEKKLDGAPVDDFIRERDRIAQQVHEQAWNERIQSYASTLGGDQLDASLLLMSYYGFERADSPRMRATYQAITQQLRAPDNLLYRYLNGPKEGAFGICSFWEVEYLALGGGTLQQASDLFAHLLKLRNDVGLYAEEIDPRGGAALGNFPQAFTHVGLISAAMSIVERMRGETPLAHRKPGKSRQVEEAA